MGLYQPLSILLFFGFLIELYAIYYDYYTPIPAKVATATNRFEVDDYLDFIANKTIDVIKCHDADRSYNLQLQLENPYNIWRFCKCNERWIIPIQIARNSILRACMMPFIAFAVAVHFVKMIESFLDFGVQIIVFFVRLLI